MKKIEWTEEYSVNVASLDQQHKRLIAILNEFNEALVENRSKTAIRPILEKLVQYTEDHFAVEEGYFKQVGFPESESHIKEHKDLIKKIYDMRSRFDSGRLLLSTDVSQFLRDWLMKHILVSDKKFSELFVAKGIK